MGLNASALALIQNTDPARNAFANNTAAPSVIIRANGDHRARAHNFARVWRRCRCRCRPPATGA
jgi:hypothetical protein